MLRLSSAADPPAARAGDGDAALFYAELRRWGPADAVDAADAPDPYAPEDRALVRRFQKIDVMEPSIEDTVKILKGLKPYFEDYHRLKYTNEAIEAAVQLPGVAAGGASAAGGDRSPRP